MHMKILNKDVENMQTYKRWQPYWMTESESQKILIG